MLAVGVDLGAAVSRVHVQIQGCLRSTCSRKVAQALHKGKIGLASVGDLTVDNAEHGLASFTPKSGTLDLLRMRSELDRAGYGVKLIVLETTDGSKIEQLGAARVTVAPGCDYSLPAEWKNSAPAAQQFLWVPPGAKGSTSDLTVCAVR